MAKAAASFSFYAILYRAVRGMDEILRRDLPMQPSGIPHLHTLCGAREGTVCHSAEVQREKQDNLLGAHRSVADRQNLYARGFPGVFSGARKTKKSKWILSDGHCAAAHVGNQDEADQERTVGNGV